MIYHHLFGTDLVDVKVITMAMKLRNSPKWLGNISSAIWHRPGGRQSHHLGDELRNSPTWFDDISSAIWHSRGGHYHDKDQSTNGPHAVR